MVKRNISLLVKTALLWLFLCLAVGVPIVISAPNADVDLAITKTDSVDPVVAGQPLSYLLSVSNAGPSTATGVVITDTLPGGVTYTSASNGCVYNAGSRTVSCATSDVGSGSVVSATVQVRVDPATTGSLLNNATVSTLDTDTNASNNTAQATTTITTSSDLSLSMTAPGSVIAGDFITYTLAISNTGPSDARGVVLQDDFPAGTSYISASIPCSVQGHRLTCNQGVVAASNRTNVTITLRVDPGKTGTVSNDGQVSATTPDPNTTNNSATRTTPVVISSDIRISKNGTPDQVTPGELLTYTITARNAGLSDGQGVSLSDPLPSRVSFQSYTATKGTCAGTSTITCSPGSLTPGETITVTLVGRVATSAAAGVITNTVSVISTSPDPNLLNNSASKSTTIVMPADSADLQITKHDLSDPIRAGQLLTYTIAINNNGPAIATGVIVTDTLPVSAALSSISTSQGTCAEIICAMGTMSASSRAVITMTVNVYPTVTGVITNTARVSANEADPVAGNNSALETTTILNETADLRISKHDLIDPVRAGEALTYIISVSNMGPANATSVVVTDTLPVSTTLSSIATSQGTCTQSICALGTINATRGALITVTVDVDPTATGVITNIASVSGSEEDLVPGNNSAQEATTLLPGPADLQIAKHDLTDPVRAGETVSYIITVSNVGPVTASGVVVTDTLPTSVTLQSILASQGNCVLARCNLGILAAAGRATITMTANVDPSATGVITNSVVVSGNEVDLVIGNNRAQESTRIVQAADLSVEKTGTPEPVFAGRNLAYRLQISNHGPSRAEGVHVVDSLPSAVSFLSAPPGCVHSSGSVDCSVGRILPGASVVVTVTVQVNPAATGLVTNRASLSSSTSDPGPTNNQSEWITNILAPDNQKPTVSWLQPVLNGQRLNVMCQVVRLQVSATDNVAIHHVRFFRWDSTIGSGAYVEIGTDTTAPYQWDLNTCALSANWNQIFAEAQDTYGNLDWSSPLERKFIWLFRNLLFLPNISR